MRSCEAYRLECGHRRRKALDHTSSDARARPSSRERRIDTATLACAHRARGACNMRDRDLVGVAVLSPDEVPRGVLVRASTRSRPVLSVNGRTTKTSTRARLAIGGHVGG